MTGLLSKSREGKPPANSGGGGWSMKDVNRFLYHEMGGLEMMREQAKEEIRMKRKEYSRKRDPNEPEDPMEKINQNTPPLGGFDVVIFRVMHGWMKTDEITPSRLTEAIHLAAELFGANTVILQTIPFTNNVKTEEDWKGINRLNAVIRNIAKNWHPKNSTLPDQIMVHEYGQYVNHIIWSNARHIGYDVSDPLNADANVFETEGPKFLFERLNDGQEYSPSIPMVCSDMASLGDKHDKCNRNYLFSDGMHVCPERLSFRYAVGLACLVGCVYNRCDEGEGDVRGCERECNDLFMSVVPIDDGWIDDNVTLASYA